MRHILEAKYNILKNLLSEAEWNFHHGKNHDMSPYYSESKYVCYHETGQFGSGTYFSTYNNSYEKNDDMEKYGDSYRNHNPNFIKVGESVYRVDFDLYQNLYKVYSEKQGDILHTMCSYLNSFFHKVSGFGLGHYQPKQADFDNSRIYQIIRYNSDSLGLKCPSYLQLTRMAQKHAQNENKQSFSTLFMEWNGFNGVNVSGIDKFDNSRHGSVIYDLSKTSLEPVKLGKTGWLHNVGSSHTNTIATRSWDFKDSSMIDSLKGNLTTLGWDEMNPQQQSRLIKNVLSSNQFSTDDISRMLYITRNNKQIQNYIFRQLFNSNKVDSEITLDGDIKDDIIKNKQYYFVNYTPNKNYRGWRSNDFFEEFLSDYKWSHWNATNEELKFFLNKLMKYLKRPLTQEEDDYIKEDYFEKEENNVNESIEENLPHYPSNYKNSLHRFSGNMEFERDRLNNEGKSILDQSFTQLQNSGLDIDDFLIKKTIDNLPPNNPSALYCIVDANVAHLPLYFEKKHLLFAKYKFLTSGLEINQKRDESVLPFMKPRIVDLRNKNNPKIIYN